MTDSIEQTSDAGLDDLKPASPYGYSTFGQYSRYFLLVLLVPLIGWLCFRGFDKTNLLLLVESLALGGMLLFPKFGAGLLRAFVLFSMLVNVVSIAVNHVEISGGGYDAPPQVIVYLLSFCMATATFFELKSWVANSQRGLVVKLLGWGVLTIPALAYIVAVPLWTTISMQYWPDETKLALKDPDWKLVNEMSFRASKFAVFATFTFLGACLGSFLNVVAYCLPRGESIGLRDSSCPQCQAKIQRVDNLPIFSFINLGGRCRNCRQVIPIRYLLVELVVALIFGSLFLYELLAGCSNVPNFNISHRGVLWIILYPKWPAIGLYIYHVLWMSALVMLALIEIDRLPLKIRHILVLMMGFLLPAVFLTHLQPIGIEEKIPGWSLSLAPNVAQAVKLGAGLVAGVMLGAMVRFLAIRNSNSTILVAFGLSGMVLGWQGLIQILPIYAICFLLAGLGLANWERVKHNSVSVLVVAVMIHQPFWRFISSWW